VIETPIPPRDLISRTDCRFAGRSDEWFREFYESSGLLRREAIVRALPPGFSFEGKAVLDFGCGAGRVLRQFLPEAESARFWGCDLHGPTIRWLHENLTPPFRFYKSKGLPLPHSDRSFDLVYAISVFTHITHDWSAWLLELHRILKPGGLLLATFIGPRAWERALKRTIDEQQLGMAALRLEQSLWETSGPLVLHSPWWIEARWGRAFEIVSIRPHGFAWPAVAGQGEEEMLRTHGPGHGVVVGRKRDIALTRDDLEWPEQGDPRELAAQRQQLALLEEDAIKARNRWERTKVRDDEPARSPRPPSAPGE
jgi:SAM-dependent methyltransferase